jgi:uncharacterized protein YfaT (DUF1175 family)
MSWTDCAWTTQLMSTTDACVVSEIDMLDFEQHYQFCNIQFVRVNYLCVKTGSIRKWQRDRIKA